MLAKGLVKRRPTCALRVDGRLQPGSLVNSRSQLRRRLFLLASLLVKGMRRRLVFSRKHLQLKFSAQKVSHRRPVVNLVVTENAVKVRTNLRGEDVERGIVGLYQSRG